MTLREKLDQREAVAAVVGLGYVGLPLAIEINRDGGKVLGFEVDQSKVDKINAGQNYIQDVDDAELAKFVADGLLSATTDFSRVPEVDVICIAVPTPINHAKEPDLELVRNATERIAEHLQKGQLVILKSTTYPGTTDEVVLPILEKVSGLKAGKDFYLAFAPERIDPGNEKYGTGNTPKVVGGIDPESTKLAADFFRLFIDEVCEVSSTRAAEMTKILENTFRLINVSFINEMAIIARRMDIDIWEVVNAAKTKPFGFMPFYPGPGLGGHCIPVDPYYLSYKAKEYGIPTEFIDVSSKIDDYMHQYVLELTEEALKKDNKELSQAKLLILGVAYKKDIDDLRESPALKVLELLEKNGVSYDYYDSHVKSFAKEEGKGERIESIPALTKESLGEYDAALILTDHSDVDYDLVLASAKRVIDTRHAIKKPNEKVTAI